MPAGADIKFDNFDFVDFAQEFLRRNPIYQAEYDRLSNSMAPKLGSENYRTMARSWGLEFRVSTFSSSAGTSRNLGCL